MDLRNIPYRSDVVTWNADDLAEYFRTLKYKDCEKVVRKHSINGQRFLNMSENDIQKFPKLRVPIVSKLSQEINKNEGRLSFLSKWAQTQRSPENPELSATNSRGDCPGFGKYRQLLESMWGLMKDNILQEGLTSGTSDLTGLGSLNSSILDNDQQSHPKNLEQKSDLAKCPLFRRSLGRRAPPEQPPLVNIQL